MAGTAADLDSLMRLVEAENPDVVVTDIRMPPTGTDEGIRAAAWLRTEHPHVGVVVLSQYADPAYALALLADGSEGRAYLLTRPGTDATARYSLGEEASRYELPVDRTRPIPTPTLCRTDRRSG